MRRQLSHSVLAPAKVVAVSVRPVLAVVSTATAIGGGIDSDKHRADGETTIRNVCSAAVSSISESLRERREPRCSNVSVWQALPCSHVRINEKRDAASDERANLRAGGVVIAEAAGLQERELVDADGSTASSHRVCVTRDAHAELQNSVVRATLCLAECEADSSVGDLLAGVCAKLRHHAADVAERMSLALAVHTCPDHSTCGLKQAHLINLESCHGLVERVHVHCSTDVRRRTPLGAGLFGICFCRDPSTQIALRSNEDLAGGYLCWDTGSNICTGLLSESNVETNDRHGNSRRRERYAGFHQRVGRNGIAYRKRCFLRAASQGTVVHEGDPVCDLRS